tara:strand:+ start:5338 stop:7143 length:1806 start_codon:yes stop_codon:yes gene_type:complete
MAKKFKPPIDYTSRDFDSIKRSLINYAKKYYPNTSNDFNEASFGALMVDMVSYIGDIMSFYLDYQANESFVESAIEFKNVIRLAEQMGYKYEPEVTAYGTVAIFVKVPANTSGLGPDTDYIPILKRNSKLTSTQNTSFILTSDVDFKNANNQVLVSDVDAATGTPTHYAIKAYGEVISGDVGVERFVVGDYTPFLKLTMETDSVAEILSVVDSDGNDYYQVDYLSQDIVYLDSLNTNTEDRDYVSNILKPASVPRRFVLKQDPTSVSLQFGQGSSTDAITENDDKLDPNKVALKMHGKKYISESSFDPTVLVKNNNLGVAPENTTVSVFYRTNLTNNVNAGVDSVNRFVSADFEFENPELLTDSIVQGIVTTAEVSNEEPIVGTISDPGLREIKIRAKNSFATQNRAVTKKDYLSLVYSMPSRFGSVARAMIKQDKDSFKRNLNLYVVSLGLDATLFTTKRKIKANLKNWLAQYKMLNDTIDIIDAKILNLGIEYKAIGQRNVNKLDLIQDINDALRQAFIEHPQIGESFFITDVYNVINSVPGVVDADDVEIFIPRGELYSDFTIDLDNYISPDGRSIKVPDDVIWEIKFIGTDIKGTIL